MTMWQAHVTKRDLLEHLLSGKSLPATECQKGFEIGEGLNSDGIMLFWKENPQSSEALPTIAVAQDDKVLDLLAALGASPQIPIPFTAFCRVLSETDFKSIAEASADVRKTAISGLAGVAIAESLVYSAGSMRIADVNPASCKRTLAFACGKGLIACPASSLSRMIDGWLETQSLVNHSSRLDTLQSSSISAIPIITLTARLYFGIPPEEPIEALCSEILEFGEPSEDIWQEIRSRSPSLPSLRTLASATREERGSFLQESLKLLRGGPTNDFEVAIRAFMATRIAPGSFEHMSMLTGFPDQRLVLWYGFFAALQRRQVALRGYGGLGLRIMRDMLKKEVLDEPPTADIALNELRIQARSGIESLGRRLSHSNEIIVEIFPLLPASFRFNVRGERTTENFSEQPKQVEMLPPKHDISIQEKLLLVQQLLADIARKLPRETNSSPVKTKGIKRKT